MTGQQVTAPRPVGDFSDAPCVGSLSLFFEPDGMEPRQEREFRESSARALCNACPFQEPCLRGALERREQFGIWAGRTATQLRYMRRRGIAS